MNKELKNKLNKLVLEHETPEFITNDPIQFVHRFNEVNEKEIVGFIASTFAYGNRTKIILAIDEILNLIDNDPYNFTLNFSKRDFKLLAPFKYRFHKGNHLCELFIVLSRIINEYGSIGSFVRSIYDNNDENIEATLIRFSNYFQSESPISREFKFFASSPKTSASKRLCMYFRWMVRSGQVDLGLWDFIDTSKLVIPLDTHVYNVSKKLQLTSLNTESWKMAQEITSNLKKLDVKDPVKYDFAIFSAGINKIEI